MLGMSVKRWLFAILTVIAVAGQQPLACSATDVVHIVGQVHTPIPPYPYTARQNYEQGAGTVRVWFDGSGKAAKATIAHSTGYEDLDENVVSFARAHWTGPPNATVNVPVDYRLGKRNGDPGSGKRLSGQWYTPTPHYPHAAVQFLESGSGMVRVATDATGRINHAEMIRSTGVKRLDENTIHYALNFWGGPSNSTKEVPVSYVMRAPHY